VNEPTQIPESVVAALATVRDHLLLPEAADDQRARDERDRLLAHRVADVAFVLADVALPTDETTEMAAAHAVRLLHDWAKRYPVAYATREDDDDERGDDRG
jgi:hypothetical protein